VILGVPQIVLNVANLDAQHSDLAEQGYTQTFAERGLANNAEKAPFQAAARGSLDMVHLTAPRREPALELTQYDGGLPCGETVYRLGPNTRDAVRVVEVRARELDRSAAFWTALGFRETAPAENGCRTLEIPAPLPDWRLAVRLRREQADAAPATTVDADGVVLVTALSSDLERDLERLAPTAARRSAPWAERVAGRAIRVAIVEGPSGELVELLQAPEGR
jgi:hypothetical protein